MFAVAIWLTDMVTRLAPDPIATNTYRPDRMPFQMAAVLTARQVDADTGYEYTVSYADSDRPGRVNITFFVHPPDQPIILLASRTDPPECYLISEFFAEDPPPSQTIAADILNDIENNQKVYQLRPVWQDASAEEQIVRCYTPSLTRHVSFTGRAADFYFNDRPPPDAPNAVAVPRLLFRFSGIAQARDLSFRGGVDLQEGRDARETSRFLNADTVMSVHWEQAGQQSLRDTLLIVIGTLIGIGVTVLIEAVKPYLEALERPRASMVAKREERPAEPGQPVQPAPPAQPPPPA
jgi:hypothetical protein